MTTSFPMSVSIREHPVKTLIELPKDHGVWKLLYELALAILLSPKLLCALATVTFDTTPDDPALQFRIKELRTYLLLEFPKIHFTNEREAYAWHYRDDAFNFPDDTRRQQRHTVHIKFSLYRELHMVFLHLAQKKYELYYEPCYLSFLRFFTFVCLLHEFGHLARTVFASQPTPLRYDPKTRTMKDGEAGYDVERLFFGAVVLMGYHAEGYTDRQFIRKWENVRVLGFKGTDDTRYLSFAQQSHPLWEAINKDNLDDLEDLIGLLPTKNEDYRVDAVGRKSPSIGDIDFTPLTNCEGGPNMINGIPEATPGLAPTDSNCSLLCLSNSQDLSANDLALLGLNPNGVLVLDDRSATKDVIQVTNSNYARNLEL
ncbi:hypothetical protein Moror_6936 [Moniliophthora roreri MCA 2997]|uniref:Uncharacterized protein n=1 Tax=Moniliophthora roreri (strain MCA 2997) TaxID=1381753 RepID=V2XB53_MONRO|nr:hypothetical protein Moror_6936 [Moniliophthora roreri MCA 2997]